MNDEPSLSQRAKILQQKLRLRTPWYQATVEELSETLELVSALAEEVERLAKDSHPPVPIADVVRNVIAERER